MLIIILTAVDSSLALVTDKHNYTKFSVADAHFCI